MYRLTKLYYPPWVVLRKMIKETSQHQIAWVSVPALLLTVWVYLASLLISLKLKFPICTMATVNHFHYKVVRLKLLIRICLELVTA